MSSMVQGLMDMGISPDFTSLGAGYYKDEKEDENNYNYQKKRFSTAQEAQEYAKANPGIIITRSPDGNGYIVKG